eukprot:TRINITY_DN14800_c0_g1_i2.p1 TRINITY_DN14800_c0_g1~~TRINITY_DN14800_c0_g1_i2.p1  ORF type:complete len:245 (-),score=24.54 TRINITY_DN14800_c0_g1_i2:12-746(-)
MINIPIKLGEVEQPLWHDRGHQSVIQNYILIICLICTAVMFFSKPVYYLLKSLNISSAFQSSDKIGIKQFNDKEYGHQQLIDEEESQFLETQNSFQEKNANKSQKCVENQTIIEIMEIEKQNQLNYGQIIIHQLIYSIEFILGSVSNTASYLRLWALSLAHSQLSDLFFQLILGDSVKQGNILKTVLFMFVFLNLTFLILFLMDIMECFLHALRLQWIEFQGKFFSADGFQFEPFDFKKYPVVN